MKIKIFVAALLAAMTFVSCSENADQEKTSEASSSGKAADSQPQTSSEEVSDSSTDVSDNDSSNAQSEADSENDDSEDHDDGDYQKLLNSVDKSAAFMQASGDEITFGDLLDQGFANVTGDGQAYCLVKGGGSAGSVFFKVYFTQNGGGSWEDGGNVTIFSGKLQTFRLEDGRILMFDKVTAALPSNPYAYILTFNEKSVTLETDERYFDGLALNDGTKLAHDSNVEVKGEYLGGYVLHLTVTGEDGKVLLNSNAALDSVDLGLAKPGTAQ